MGDRISEHCGQKLRGKVARDSHFGTKSQRNWDINSDLLQYLIIVSVPRLFDTLALRSDIRAGVSAVVMMSKLGKKHLSQDQRSELIRRAGSGEHPNALAIAFNVKVRQVYKILEAELPANAQRRKGARGAADATKEQALGRIAAGESVVAVAKSLGLDRVTLFRWKRAATTKPLAGRVKEASAWSDGPS